MSDRAANEALLLRRAARGDSTAWEVLYRRHRDFVHRVACRFLGDAADSQDVVQDVFVSVFRSAGLWRDEASFRTWLWRATANRCLNHRRRAGREVPSGGTADPSDPLLSMPDPRGTDPAQDAPEREALERLRAAFARLPDRGRLALVLVCLEGLTYAQAADAMGCSVSAVESLLVRARRELAAALRDA